MNQKEAMQTEMWDIRTEISKSTCADCRPTFVNSSIRMMFTWPSTSSSHNCELKVDDRPANRSEQFQSQSEGKSMAATAF